MMRRGRILVLAAVFAHSAFAQERTTRPGPGDSGGALMSVLGVQADDSPLQVRPRRAHKNAGDLLLPFEVQNTSRSRVTGFRLVAFIISDDGTVRLRQPFESSRRLDPGKKWSGEMTLRDPLITSSHSGVLVVEQAGLDEGAFELPRKEAERAAVELFRQSLRRRR